MALTECAIYYNTGSGFLHAIVVPDDDDQLTGLVAPPGRTIITTSLDSNGHPPSAHAARQAIAHAHGGPVVGDDDDRCCVVDGTNTVVTVIKADPAVDAVQGMTLVLSQLANPGDTWDGAQFNRRYAFVNSLTNVVVSIVTRPVVAQVNAPAGEYAISSTILQVGQTAPPRST